MLRGSPAASQEHDGSASARLTGLRRNDGALFSQERRGEPSLRYRSTPTPQGRSALSLRSAGAALSSPCKGALDQTRRGVSNREIPRAKARVPEFDKLKVRRNDGGRLREIPRASARNDILVRVYLILCIDRRA